MPESKAGVLLDVMFEGMRDLLADKGWVVETVTGSLGAENRDGAKIMEYARARGLAVVTGNKKLYPRLKAAGIGAVLVADADLAAAIDRQLLKMRR